MFINAEPHHCKRSFDVAFKQKIIQFVESKSKDTATRVFNINQKCVQTWNKQKAKIITMVGEVRGRNKKR